MLETIFVGFMIVIALGAGIWAWWIENGPDNKVESQKDNSDDKRREI